MKNLLSILLLVTLSAIILTSEAISADTQKGMDGKPKYVRIGQTSVDYLTLAIGLEKQTYILDEPIEVAFILTNNSDQKKRLAEPSWNDSTVDIKVTQIEGETPILVQPEFMRIGTSDDYKFTFKPGESKYSTTDILTAYPKGLPVGKYIVQCVYRTSNKLNLDWHGIIESVPIEFNIVNPATEQEIEVRQEYLKARAYIHQKKTASNVIGMTSIAQSLGEVGVFNKYIEFYEADAYRQLKNLDEFRIRILSYTDKYGMNDKNSILGLTILGDIYQMDEKNYNEARKIYGLLPDGYDRMNNLKNCDLREAQQKELDKNTSGSDVAL